MPTKRRINLSLTPDHFEAARDLLARLPGTPSVSSLVDEMLRDFVLRVGPHLEQIAAASPGERMKAVKDIHAELLAGIAVELADTLRTIEREGDDVG